MNKEFAGKSVLVTGATSGIGRATAMRFAQDGASIAAVGRDEAELLQLQNDLNSTGTQFLACDRIASISRRIGLLCLQGWCGPANSLRRSRTGGERCARERC